MDENQVIINKVVDNLGSERFVLQHLKRQPQSKKYDNERYIFREIMSNDKIIQEIKRNIHIDNNILGDMEHALDIVKLYGKDSIEYQKLKNKT